MKSIQILVAAVLAFLLSVCPAQAGMRCGNDIISEGDTKMTVRVKIQKCGEILERDTYTKVTAQDDSVTEKLIEQWYIRIKERGSHYCYPLEFEEGRLTTIGQWTRCD